MANLMKILDGLIVIVGSIAALLICWNVWTDPSWSFNFIPLLAFKKNASSTQWRLNNFIQAAHGSQNLDSEDYVKQQNQTEPARPVMDRREQFLHPKVNGEYQWKKTFENFYVDADFSYSMEKPMRQWDKKRRLWLRAHPHIKNYTEGGKPRILVLSGSQSQPCKNPVGDHLLLRLFKNKQDYCRLHGLDLFYNNVLLHPQMIKFWAKIPLIRAAMVAHPEAEWIWWIDSDAVITDMEFELPLEKYMDFNMALHGWEKLIYEKRSWVGVNAGVFLLRNCEWSMEFMERWSAMGPQSPLYVSFAKILTDVLPDRTETDADDQSALIYLLIKEKEKWADKIFVENSYYLHGYWLDLVGAYENITAKYESMEAEYPVLKERYAEKSARTYAEMRERFLERVEAGMGERRPFVTHFAGCQPCSGKHNKIYTAEICWTGMERALNFADNQVLRIYGYRHKNLQSSEVMPIPFH